MWTLWGWASRWVGKEGGRCAGRVACRAPAAAPSTLIAFAGTLPRHLGRLPARASRLTCLPALGGLRVLQVVLMQAVNTKRPPYWDHSGVAIGTGEARGPGWQGGGGGRGGWRQCRLAAVPAGGASCAPTTSRHTFACPLSPHHSTLGIGVHPSTRSHTWTHACTHRPAPCPQSPPPPRPRALPWCAATTQTRSWLSSTTRWGSCREAVGGQPRPSVPPAGGLGSGSPCFHPGPHKKLIPTSFIPPSVSPPSLLISLPATLPLFFGSCRPQVGRLDELPASGRIVDAGMWDSELRVGLPLGFKGFKEGQLAYREV